MTEEERKRMTEECSKQQRKNNRDSELIYIEADKYLSEVKAYIQKSYFCNRLFRKDYKRAYKLRLKYGPDAVVLIHTLTRETIRLRDVQ